MLKKYKSDFYSFPIEVEKENWEIIVKILTEKKQETIYSYYDLEEKTSYSPYVKNAILGSFLWKIPQNIFILGFWAWSYAKYFKDYLWNNINITWVEIDESMIKIAKNEFWLKNINYFNLDYLEALQILNKKKKKFDIIFIDLYDKNSQIPESLNNFWIIKNIISLLSQNWKLIVNFANYKENKNFYKQIEEKILDNLKNKQKIEFLNWKDDFWNVVWIYNLSKSLNSQEVLLNYLEKVQAWLINYDSNLITKIFLKK